MHFIQCKAYVTAKKQYPSAAIICKVEGGFIAFDTMTEYETWKNQI